METFYVIIGNSMVYGAFNNKICAMSEFKNVSTKEDSVNEVKAIVFSYAENRPNVYLCVVNKPKINCSNDVFRFLQKEEKTNSKQ